MFSKFIQRVQPAPQTHAAISMKTKLFAVNSKGEHSYLGAVSRFEPTMGRPVEAVKGIGAGDVLIELVPNYSDVYTFSLETTLFYLRNLFQLFGYYGGVDGLVRALRHHKYPFDMKEELVFSEIAELEAEANTEKSSDGHRCLVTYYEACWMTSYRHGFTTDTSRILESVDVSVTDIVPAFAAIDPNTDTGNSIRSKGLTKWYQPLGSGGAGASGANQIGENAGLGALAAAGGIGIPGIG